MASRKKAPSAVNTELEAQIKAAGKTLAGAEKRKLSIPAEVGGPDSIEVGYNGMMFLIKRGVEVELPVQLCEILEHSGLV